MTQKTNRKLKIGFISPTIGCFGAIREMIEVSNTLIGKGHGVYIYHPDGSACKWLTCLASCRKLTFLQKDVLDVLIGIVDWQPELYSDLLNADAKVKAICLLGFSPSEEMAKALRGEIPPADKAQKIILDAMQKNFLILTDSSWQIDWVKQNIGYEAGPSFGGVNLSMFHPASASVDSPKKYKIIYSGDPRDRKGTDTVEAAIGLLKANSMVNAEYDFYWGKKFSQPKLVEFIQSGDIFLDGHRRAGWCNPVAEAIACGTVPVCTDIGANRDFAIHRHTALVVPVDSPEAMANAALELMRENNQELRHTLRQNGLKHIQKFSYDQVVPVLENVLETLVYA